MNDIPTINPAFPESENAIVFAANDYYCPYLSVMLHSVIEHISSNHLYDIIVLNRDISDINKNRLLSMIEDDKTIRLRFFDVSRLVKWDNLYTGGKEKFSVDTYLRLLIPYVLSGDYKKALYLDSDMLALTDVYPLLEEDITGYMLASTRDMCGIAAYYYPWASNRSYIDSVLKLKYPDRYFIAGMMILNLAAFRGKWSCEYILEIASSRNWKQHDQDVLNVLCNNGDVKLLDASWDVLKPYKSGYLPAKLQRELMESMKYPKIIHFGGNEKPWWNTLSPWMDLFWDTAVKTPFYKDIIYRILEYNPGNTNEATLEKFRGGEIGFYYLVKYFIAWLKYKIRRQRQEY